MSADQRIVKSHTNSDGSVRPPLAVGNNGEVDYDAEARQEMAMRRYENGLETD